VKPHNPNVVQKSQAFVSEGNLHGSAFEKLRAS